MDRLQETLADLKKALENCVKQAELSKEDLKTQTDRLQETITDLKKAQENSVKQAELIKNYRNTLKRLKHPFVPNTSPELEEYQHYPIQTVIFTTWARMQNLVGQQLQRYFKKENIKTQIDRLQVTLADLKKAQESCMKQAELIKNYSDTLKRLQQPSEPNTTPELEEYQHYPIQTVIFTTWARMQNLVEQRE
ncbi:zinc-binding A33-like protein [Labeo rohita]|uniref:Zinc-binding A33-like protein n=1 Tax=Labeo rohita TaxID=84645 RepID=A0A498N6C5_LABRO|nr:zinc-binding A33-like protein [Labeo rohita]RXN27252.1 zinc-binding A33-like protein [Labeo rohita]